MDAEREKLREILAVASASTPMPFAAAPEAPPSSDATSASVVHVRPTAGSIRGLREEGRAEVARQGVEEALLSRLVTLLVVGDTLIWYGPNGHQVDAFVLRTDATRWAEGWYLATAARLLRLVELDDQRDWVPWSFEKEDVGYLTHWLRSEDSQRFLERLAREGDVVALVGVPSATPTGGTGTADTKAAERLVGGVRERLADETGEEGVAAPERRAVPDRLVVWSDERGPFVNVWVDGAHTALPVADDETVEALTRRVEEAAEGLRESRDAEASTRLLDGAAETGFTGRAKPDAPVLEGSERDANAPAYPAHIVNHGPDITVTGATQRFEMLLDYAPAGMTTLDQVGARLQPISYVWDIYDVTDVKSEARGDLTYRSTAPIEQLSRMEGSARDFERTLEDSWEDTRADVADVFSGPAPMVAATWPARSAWLGVVGLSNVVRLGKASISSYIDLLTTPRSEQGIGWDREGEFLIRCIATPSSDEGSVVRRASSIATFAVKVVDVNRRATEVNERGASELRRLEAERDGAEGEAREQLEARIAALRRAETGTAAELGGDALRALEQRITVADRLAADNKAGTPREQRSPEARLLSVQLELQGIPLDEYQRELKAQKEGMDQRLRLIGEVDGRIPGRDFRPHVTLVSEETGQVNELIMMLGEAEDSREGKRHYLLADVTAPSPRDRYVFEGRGTQPGTAGHAEAVRAAFVDFRENNGYGRGTLAIRLPEGLEKAAGGPLGLEPRMRSAPGSRARVMQRLRDLATAAELAGLVLTGPVGLAVGAAGAVAGAIVAVDSLSRRHSAGALRWDFETIMDVSSIVGGVAGVAAPTLGMLRNVPRWANRVERLQGMLHIYGIAQTGSTVIVIPVQLEMELSALEKQKGQLSPGELAAKRAEAILGAVRSGLMTVASVAQMLHPGDTGGTRRTWEPESAEHLVDAEPGRPLAGEPTEARMRPDGEARVTPEGEGAMAARGDGVEAVTAARPPEVSKRVLRLESELGDLRGRVAVVEHPGLKGTSTRVRYRRGRFQLEVGPDAGPFQIRTHLETARILLRYEGPIGHIRRLLSRITQVFTRIPGYGTQGFESRLEVRKLRGIIDELEAMQRGIEGRIEQLGGKDGESLAREVDAIQRQIDDLQGQLYLHELLVDSLDVGQGVVAGYDKHFVKGYPEVATELLSIEAELTAIKRVFFTGLIERVAQLQAQGRVVGFQEWVRMTAAVSSNREQLLSRIGDLGGVELQARSLDPGQQVHLRPVPDPAGGAPLGLDVVNVRLPGTQADQLRERGTNEGAMLDALQLGPERLLAFDYVVEQIRGEGDDPEVIMPKRGKATIRRDVEAEFRRQADNERWARHAFNITGDLLDPWLATMNELNDKNKPDEKIFLDYESKAPTDTERRNAKELYALTGEEIHLFGDDASKANYPAIDGTIGSPRRPLQLKNSGEKALPIAARIQASSALENAIALGIRGVEVHIWMEAVSRDAVRDAWNAPLPEKYAARRNWTVFDGDHIARIVIHCPNNERLVVVRTEDNAGRPENL